MPFETRYILKIIDRGRAYYLRDGTGWIINRKLATTFTCLGAEIAASGPYKPSLPVTIERCTRIAPYAYVLDAAAFDNLQHISQKLHGRTADRKLRELGNLLDAVLGRAIALTNDPTA